MIKVAEVETKGRELYVTIEADTITEALSNDARQLAYEERTKHGFHNAGIEASGGPFPYDRENKDVVVDRSKVPTNLGYRHVYRLTMFL